MKLSTKNATPPKVTKSRNSNSSVRIRIKPKIWEFVPRDTEESEFLDLAGFGDAAFSVETVICVHLAYHCALPNASHHTYLVTQ